MILRIVNVETGETVETYENVNPDNYNRESKTISVPAGKGTMQIQFGEGYAIEEISEDVEEDFTGTAMEYNDYNVNDR